MSDDGTITENDYKSSPTDDDIEFVQKTEGALEVDPNTSDALANWSHALKEHTGSGSAMVSALSEFMGNPGELPSVMAELAEKEGVSTAALLSEAQTVAADLDKAISDYVGAQGADPRSWFSYTFANRRGEFMSALNEAVFVGNMDAFHSLVHAYKRTDTQAHRQAHQVSPNDQDVVHVNVGGRTITTNTTTARRNGWL